MVLQELVLRNFRVYEGENRFDLSPRRRYGKLRPIVLFGGLNGSGKTSLLMGLRLALYGRSSLGSATSQKEYEEFLRRSVYRSRKTNASPHEASVELMFTYAKFGVGSQFQVIRHWKNSRKSVKESLKIFEDGQPIEGLSQEQAQTFLNELIPIGVSDLFFFDGEKIKELAEDTGGAVLEGSIKKLMGLDVVERLLGDLVVLNRNLTKSSSISQVKQAIEGEQLILANRRRAIEEYRREISTVLAQRAEIEQRYSQVQLRLDERGGNFSASRRDLEKDIDAESNRKAELVSEIVLFLADAAPLYLSGEYRQKVETRIRLDLDSSDPFSNRELTDRLRKGLSKKLGKHFSRPDVKKVNSALDELIESFSTDAPEILHDLTLSQASQIISSFTKAEDEAKKLAVLFRQLEACETKLDELGVALSRAPEDSVIQADFDELQKLQTELASTDVKLAMLRGSAKKEAELAIDSARKLDKLYDKAAKGSDRIRVVSHMNAAAALLDEFIRLSTRSKIADLEEQFIDCFARLARKEDLNLRIKVDPETFVFDLFSEGGHAVDKDDLSAGEKQIFAISILEALAKTSGRQLPMIVDTPLGRLDSMHRSKLIQEYFPRASHQMIILSTDTEVDEEFYQALSPDVARAFRLEYNPELGATDVVEGYFWQQRKAG